MIKVDNSALIEAYLKNGGKVTLLTAGRKTKDTYLNRYSAWGRTMMIGHMGRQYNTHRKNVAGTDSNKADFG